jgi:hypothetical protein
LQQQEELAPLKGLYSPQHTALSHADTTLDTEQKVYLQSAKELYLKALEIEPHCPYTNARCAKALWAMPLPYKDKKRATDAIVHALTLAPHSSFVRKLFFKLIFYGVDLAFVFNAVLIFFVAELVSFPRQTED